MPSPRSEGPATDAGASIGPAGRDAEIETLRAAVTHAAGGAPGAALITGPLGIGKTRMAYETLALAARTGFTTLDGRAHAFGTIYAPLVAALGSYLRGVPPDRLESLVAGLPQLALVIGGLPLTAPASFGDPALERARLEDGLTRVLERLARERPLAVLVDDVPDVDDGTLSVLQTLTDVLRNRPVLLVLTAMQEPGTDERLGSLRRAITDASWHLTDLELDRLADEDAYALVSATADLDAAQRQAIVGRCAGRPLFLDALARSVAERRDTTPPRATLPDTTSQAAVTVPESIRAVLSARVRSVAADARTVLRVLAVAGDGLDHRVLVRASGLAEPQVLNALDDLMQRHMVGDVPGRAGYALAHRLLADTLLAEMSPVSMRRLHAVMATALEELGPGDVSPSAADHVLRAGSFVDPAHGLDLLVAGGERARRLGAVRETERYLAAAAAVAREHGRLDALARAQSTRGDIARYDGRLEDARTHWDEALAAYADLEDPAGVVRVRCALASLWWDDADLPRARTELDRAERALAGLEGSPAHADLRHAQAIVGVRSGDAEAVARAATDLRRLADGLGSPSLAAQAYMAESSLDFAGTDFVAMHEKARCALTAAEASGEAELCLRASDQVSVACAAQGDLEGFRRHSATSLELARQMGARMLEPWPLARLAIANLLSGDWDAALRGTSEVLSVAGSGGQTRGRVSASAMHGWVLTHRGRLVEARHMLEEARRLAPEGLEADQNIFSTVAIADATLLLFSDEPERAARAAARLGRSTGGLFPLLGIALLGEARTRCGDLDGALRLADQARQVRTCATPMPGAVADWVEGLTELSRGEQAKAVGRLASAATGFDSLGLPFQAARARLAAAESAKATDPGASADTARTALRELERLGAPVQARQARQLLRSLGVTPSSGRPRTDTGSPLSARELEVSRLVATGMSNAEVATELFISPRTVTTHLDRIYARLGLSSRAALTRYLYDSGLVTPQDRLGEEAHESEIT